MSIFGYVLVGYFGIGALIASIFSVGIIITIKNRTTSSLSQKGQLVVDIVRKTPMMIIIYMTIVTVGWPILIYTGTRSNQ